MAEETTTSFADFEAQQNRAETAQDAQEAPAATQTASEAETAPREPEADVLELDETAEVENEDEGDKRRRSKPAPERIAELTRARREAERRAEAAEARLAAMQAPADTQAGATDLVEPDPNQFEFGEADPSYLRALAKYEVKVELAAERQAQEAQVAQQAQRERAAALDTSWQEQTAQAAERYEDFGQVIESYTKSQPCPPILAMAIQSSECGADVAYHLAKNPSENAELARLAQTDPLEAARRFGRLEARFESRSESKPQPKRVTDAPEPPVARARGAGGKFEVSADTTDFAAFERRAMSAR